MARRAAKTSVLSKLNIGAIPKKAGSAASGASKLEQLKVNVLAELEHQISYAKAFINGQAFTVTRKKKREDGSYEEVSKKPRTWFNEALDGSWFVNIRSGTLPVPFNEEGHCAAFAESKEQIPDTLEALKRAIEAGELDKGFEAVSMKRSKARKKKEG